MYIIPYNNKYSFISLLKDLYVPLDVSSKSYKCAYYVNPDAYVCR